MKRNGFSLVELLVSMLIVSIAMLGFAALQAYSARALNSSYQKTSEVSVFQDLIKVFQVSNKPLSNELKWPADTVDFSCDNVNDVLVNSENKAISLVPSILAACSKYEKVGLNGNEDSDLRIRLSRNKITNTMYSYSLEINMAYKLKRASYSKAEGSSDNTYADESKAVTVETFCPFKGSEDGEDELNNLRIKNNVACSHVEVML
ncbi:MAG: prepilin-type N-terminal cleavage/methylation domain-containing protein [Ruminobacter sp.]|nr:prepilin-type N-terminal cleavage/methylation domain-containing protein [Ruminobacter sp.]